MRHLVPQFERPREFPPERLALEEMWALCPGHEWRDDHLDYFVQGMQVCRHCTMVRRGPNDDPDICTHVRIYYDPGTTDSLVPDSRLEFALVSHPVELGSNWDA